MVIHKWEQKFIFKQRCQKTYHIFHIRRKILTFFPPKIVILTATQVTLTFMLYTHLIVLYKIGSQHSGCLWHNFEEYISSYSSENYHFYSCINPHSPIPHSFASPQPEIINTGETGIQNPSPGFLQGEVWTPVPTTSTTANQGPAKQCQKADASLKQVTFYCFTKIK